MDPHGRWKWAKNDRLWTTYPTFDGSSTFKSINWSSIGLVDPLNCFWTKLWVSYSSNNAIQNHLNCFIKHFHVSQVWFYPPITQSKFNFQNTKKNSLKIFQKSFKIILPNPTKLFLSITQSNHILKNQKTVESSLIPWKLNWIKNSSCISNINFCIFRFLNQSWPWPENRWIYPKSQNDYELHFFSVRLFFRLLFLLSRTSLFRTSLLFRL